MLSPMSTTLRVRKSAALLLILCALLLCAPLPGLSAESSGRHDELLPPLGAALVEAGQGRWDAAAADVETFAALWRAAQEGTPDPALAGPAAAVEAALADAASSLAAGGAKPAPAKAALSTLAGAVDAYVTAASGTGGGEGSTAAGREAAAVLLPAAEHTRDAALRADWAAAKAAYQAIVDGWTPAESAIRKDNPAVYGQLETTMSLLRIALQAEPLRVDAAKAKSEALYTLLADYSAGKSAAGGTTDAAQPASIEGLLAYLSEARSAAADLDSTSAADVMEQFIAAWPQAEGKVQIAAPEVYTSIENESAAATGYLLSDPPKLEQALTVLDNMISELIPLAGEAKYTAWDAALILLREGLEAILVLAALLAYLKRSGSQGARKWIWSGAAAGLAGSAGMAVILTYVISRAAAGGAREMIEGITGLIAVVMMLTIGRWMHGKSSTSSWNSYVGRQMDGALATGSLWSLFSISALAILREGAETTIFYVGMAPSIEASQLLLGIGGSLILLILLGYAIIALSARLPVALFFRAATLLIYYLVFRFLGESLHALQVAGKIPAHVQAGWPSVSWLGLYPTLETIIPQLLLLLFIAWELVRRRTPKTAQTV
ncbi:FTR1 family protein [Paenibacillus sp. sgz500958]|uniref:FTR1 family iron permease n=1 Tax=Paenibacillus sp. sgz500958 TaxID=3242475 RepID=UPI0036D3E410